jgi:hypothetical protein
MSALPPLVSLQEGNTVLHMIVVEKDEVVGMI